MTSLAPRGWPRRWLGALGWIPLLTALPSRADIEVEEYRRAYPRYWHDAP